MYNSEQKKEYFHEVQNINENLEEWLTTVFEQTEYLEKKREKDIAEWSATEIITYYKLLSTSSLNSLNLRNSQLRSYARWCNSRNLLKDHQNHYEEITIEALQNCLNKGLLQGGIITRARMESMIRDLLNPRDKCLIYAMFEGIQGKQYADLVALNVKQIHGNKIHLDYRIVDIPDALIDLMYDSTEEYSYYAYGNSQREYRYKEDDDNVFKMTFNGRENSLKRQRQRLYTNLCRIRDFLDMPALTSASLNESGRIDMVKRLMKEDKTGLFDTLMNHDDEIANKYGRLYSKKRYIVNFGNYYNERG